MIVLSGTGARDLCRAPEVHQSRVALDVEEAIRRLGPDEIIAGGAEGFDHLLARMGFMLKIPVVLALPSPDYGDYYWREHSMLGTDRSAEFEEMLDRATQVIYVSSWHMRGRANFIRNQWMVDHAGSFLVYKPRSRGTSDCVKRIERAEKSWTEVGHLCPQCGGEFHFDGSWPICEACAGELCQDCLEAEERTWD